ncbi:hypothetical protein [Snuella lapsa]|uniref:Uncharacterized protein n=1 Tax=Snuella lapsa TaxID=870481 RepID=A0ABP6XK51_9FLAO
MIINVKEYRVIWSNGNSPYGAIDIRNDEGNQARLRSKDPNLLSFWVNILRNEEPVYYNTESNVLYTGTQPLED